MGAPGGHARRAGTGQIRCRKGKYVACKPQVNGERKELSIGTFGTRYEARKALEEWFRKQEQQNAVQEEPGPGIGQDRDDVLRVGR